MDGLDDELESIRAEAEARQSLPLPELEALQQMLSEALSREMLLRAEIVRLRRQPMGS